MNIIPAVITDSSRSAYLSNWYAREPFLARFTLVVLALVPVLLLGVIMDERTQHGVNIWIKPLKFNIAIVVYLGTLVWFSGWIDRSVMFRLWYRVYVCVLCGSMIILFTWLYSAAIIGELAHYNRTHLILAPLYSLMGVVSVIFTAGTLALAGLVAANRQSPLTPYFRYAVVCSLVVSFIFTVVVAGELASMDSHWIGGTPSDLHGLLFFGWSRDGGDLRVAHFFSLHAMHVIPLAAWLSRTKRLAGYPILASLSLSMLYGGLIIFVYLQAKQGMPFLPWLG